LAVLAIPAQTWLYNRSMVENRGISRPEARLYLGFAATIALMPSLFWFGFSGSTSDPFWWRFFTDVGILFCRTIIEIGLISVSFSSAY